MINYRDRSALLYNQNSNIQKSWNFCGLANTFIAIVEFQVQMHVFSSVFSLTM